MRQRDGRRKVRQPGRPVLQLAGGDRPAVALVAEHVALPQRVIGVLNRQRGPTGWTARPPRGVRDHDVARQRRHGLPVRRDVVHDHRQHVFLRPEPEQLHAQWRFFPNIESHHRHSANLLPCLVPFRGRRCHVRYGRLGGNDYLVGAFGIHREHRAQRLVTLDDVTDRSAQCRDVELSGRGHRERDVVHRRTRVELVDEPHPLLRR